ncbi:MAG: hypothetical protein R2824_04620 [Saprospiraceae bacterium]|nr:hypothetical protein [Lewinella sp.]
MDQRSAHKKRISRFWSPGLLAGLIICVGAWTFQGCKETNTESEPPPVTAGATVPADEVVDGVHVPTGLKVAEGFDIVRVQCTACHSGKLVAQNRATRDGWEEMIRWMQKTQGLWPLGENEPIILDYLADNYGPEDTGRRANLENVEWYILDLD